MLEHSLWHPVSLATDVADKPVTARLLDVELVLWRDASGAMHAWRDQSTL